MYGNYIELARISQVNSHKVTLFHFLDTIENTSSFGHLHI